MLFVLAAGGASAAATLGPLCEAPPSYPLHAVYGLADRLPLVPAAQRRGIKRFRQAFFKRPRSLSFMIPSALRNFAFPAKFQPMAPCYGAGPLRRSEGV